MSKYGNHITVVDGIKFDSKKEAYYYLHLRTRERNGEISNLRRQVAFELVPPVYEDQIVQLKTKEKIVKRLVEPAIHYIADFVYEERGAQVVMDVKSEATKKDKVYVLKKRMMRSLLGITIVEV